MTYTFKLARRLAVSRTLLMLPVILLFVACGGDATAPENSTSPQDDWRSREATPVAVSVYPSKVTVETNQLIRFLAYGRNDAGDSVHAPITWRATGGTILPDGRFSAAAIGTFTVTAATRTRVDERVDTSFVSVVPRQVNLSSITISPETAALTPGVSHSFTATGILRNGRPVPIGANWIATGGTIDAGGTYIAGDTAGSYLVIATNTAMTLADTATITISAPPPPPPPPAEPPAPALASVTLLPGTATLAPLATRQFKAYGRTTAGDSVAADVVFAATGGKISTGGLFTAGSTAGTYRVVATAGLLADTSTVTVTSPLGSGPAAGIGVPFGPFGLLGVAPPSALNGPFTLAHDGYAPINIVERITRARATGLRLHLAMTGGHKYLTDFGDGDGLKFDRSKWEERMERFNTPEIRAAVNQGVADGTIIGAIVMDEPNVSGAGDGNTWGPPGTMTKARVDSLCGYVKNIFPNLPVGVAHKPAAFEPTKSYRVCDYLISQYATRVGTVTDFRDAALAMGQRDGHATMFSMNIMSGGIQAKRDGLWNCPLETTGGRGTFEPNCRMTPQQIRDFARVLGPAGCGLLMWRYDDDMMSKPEYQQAFQDVAARMKTLPRKLCRR